MILAGWMNRQQQEVIDYLLTENQVLKERFNKNRGLLSDDQRRRLAVKGRVLGRKRLEEAGTLFTPGTILRWHGMLVANKWAYSGRRKNRPGRPPLSDEIRQLVVQMARENSSWGYDRIAGAMQNLGHDDSDQSVGDILKAHGIEPAPDRMRSQSWSTFLKAHRDSIFATDFTTVEDWTKSGLVTFYVLAVMHLKTRRVHIAGLTPSPNAIWMRQVCRSLTDCEDGFLKDASHLIVDRDTSFLAMREFVERNTDTRIVLLPPKSPNLNAHMERWFRSLKSECLDRMIFFGKRSLERAVRE